MALSGSALYEIRSGATANNVNGGGFNPANANMLTNLAATSATGNSPVVTSATYTFVAGDDEKWLFIKAGTNWTPGFYQIASVTGGAATLRAAIGEAVQFVAATGRWTPGTVAGCATTASPTGGTFAVDYSQATAAIITLTNGVSTASTTFTSVSAPFTAAMVGNYLHLLSATGADEAVGWYEIVSFTNTTTVVLDKVSGTYTAGSFTVGGAISFNSTLDDDFTEIMLAGNRIFVLVSASISLGEAITTTVDGGTQNPIRMIGYNGIRGDYPTGTGRPTFTLAANVWTSGDNWDYENLIFSGSGTSVMLLGANSKTMYSKYLNSSATADRTALVPGADSLILFCEAISLRGRAIAIGANNSGPIYGCYLHDSDIGLRVTQAAKYSYSFNIISDCVTAAISLAGTHTNDINIMNNTLYGCEDTLGTGVLIQTGTTDLRLLNNIIYGFVTGVDHADTQSMAYDDYNNYFNNDADVSAVGEWQKGLHDLAIDPDFTNVVQLSGATATTNGSALIQSGGDFSTVTDNVDCCHIRSGTGVTAGKYLILSHTADTLTLFPSPGTNGTADKVWRVTTGHDFSIGTALEDDGSPGVFPAALTTGHMGIGAVQRQAAAAGGGGLRLVGHGGLAA